jgi:hypothetical protein
MGARWGTERAGKENMGSWKGGTGMKRGTGRRGQVAVRAKTKVREATALGGENEHLKNG